MEREERDSGPHSQGRWRAARHLYTRAFNELTSRRALSTWRRAWTFSKIVCVITDAWFTAAPKTQVQPTIASALQVLPRRFLLVPRGFPGDWLPEGIDFRVDADLPYSDLNNSEGVLTTCAVAMAETGTIILRHSEQQGRRALTLIPDYHLCVVRAAQVAETAVEGWRLTALFAAEPITTISGPSATSDIEMTRVKGVHGPRTLDIILVV